MTAAAELRRYTERSNALHQQYLSDPQLLHAYEHFVQWQLDYMLPLYDDLRAAEDYAAAVDFVVSDLTGINISERDQDIARVVPIMSRTLPDKALVTVAAAMRLNARVLEVNLAICRDLSTTLDDGQAISEASYWRACRNSSSLDECLELVQLTGDIGYSLDSVMQTRMIGTLLRAMRTPARLAGFGALQTFLENGYRTFSALEDVDRFLNDVTQRMSDIFTRIFETPLREAQH